MRPPVRSGGKAPRDDRRGQPLLQGRLGAGRQGRDDRVRQRDVVQGDRRHHPQAKPGVSSPQRDSPGRPTIELRGAVAGALRSLGVVPALTILFVVIGGALVSSLVPLLTAILALVAVTSAAGLLSHVLDTRSVATDLAILIGLGVGVD